MPKTLYYLSLGDSVGVWNGDRSYPYLLAAKYRAAGVSQLRLVDMSCSDPNSSGAVVIAHAFEKVIGTLHPPA